VVHCAVERLQLFSAKVVSRTRGVPNNIICTKLLIVLNIVSYDYTKFIKGCPKLVLIINK